MTTLVDIGHRIRIARKARGMTAIALAELAGMHRNTLLALETGRGNIELVKLLALCEALDLDLLLLPRQAAPLRAADAQGSGSQTELGARLQALMGQGEGA
ncbi:MULTISPECIES: helix-turn-helix transcriptional regulator [unclassified Herbaspirillum]|jgi:HTH-type transcriptional regulator/antitoxin HipB|uniref:helix-turn-helix transcriptional regulator n=1 Tax=unclassified Herbaspirillum TaxID=2624150 RepID=UPI0005562338|nr:MULTISPECIES: helix-turn-helix transcriptional regulator [unclassified Herbaspirillum]NUT61795.1 helix-turn-helix transcriptional regulator [Herbaspirillum sp. C9C3]